MADNTEEKPKHETVDREQLAKDLDDDLQQFVSGLKKRTPEVPTLEEIEQQVKEHPLFLKEIPEGGQLPPLVEALQALKYDPDENSPEELARSYKDDGNFNFKIKKYRRAVDVYTEGLKQKCENVELVVQLYTNRAAAHYYLGNFRTSLSDCQTALKLIPDHIKAIVRGAQCSSELKRFSEAIEFCEIGLKLDPQNAVLLKLKEMAIKEKKVQDRDIRKASTTEKKQRNADANLMAAIRSRHLKLAEIGTKTDNQSIEFLQSSHPAASRVTLHDDGTLSWPVLLMFPEHSVTECVQSFHENVKFFDQLLIMFGPDSDCPLWDEERKYKLENLKLYHEKTRENVLVPVNLETTLLEVLQCNQYTIKNGTPVFIILVENSDYQRTFLKRYKIE